MKKIAQLSLFGFIILALFLFNKVYFPENDKNITEPKITKKQSVEKNENNLIKNLKYEVNLDQDNQYIITSELSELTYVNDIEIVKMQKVTALILDSNKIPLIINSDFAEYNNFNYNTEFRNNVLIEYMNNKIYSDKLDLNIEDNIIKIFENVRYIGAQGTIKSDNIKINLITKKIDVYMDNEKNKVEVNKN